MAEKTGTRDITYDLVSVIYHALQGAQTYSQYVQDAVNEGDQEAADFLQELIGEEQKWADKAKMLLAKRLNKPTS